MGGAWLTGGLEALARETGWDPASADYIVGTSAGSMMGSLLASGIPPWFMVAHSAGEIFEGLSGPDGRAARDADRSGGAVFQLAKGFPRIGPGSFSLIATPMSVSSRTAPAYLMERCHHYRRACRCASSSPHDVKYVNRRIRGNFQLGIFC